MRKRRFKFKSIFKKLLSNTLLIFLGIMAAFIILEITFRVLYPDPSPKLVNQALQLHKTYGISFKPDTEGWNTSLRGEYSVYVNINGKGLRGQEYDYQKEENTFRILVLGDSFTAALQVPEEKTFPFLLAEQLNQTLAAMPEAPTVEIINAGVVGYGTTNELIYFRQEGYKYEPDLVLLAFFTGNDISNNINPPHFQLEDGTLIPIKAVYNPDIGTPPWAKEGTTFRNLRNYLYTHSRLYSVMIELVVYSVIRQSPTLAQFVTSIGLVEVTRPVMNEGNIYSILQPSVQAWEMTEALILALNQEIEAQGSQLLVLILPDETEVDLEKWDSIAQEYPDLLAKAADTKPSHQLAQFLAQEEISFLQLQPPLQAAYLKQIDQSLYYQFDGHWRPEGHAIVAEEIYTYLMDSLKIGR